jgi:hypothetical protein
VSQRAVLQIGVDLLDNGVLAVGVVPCGRVQDVGVNGGDRAPTQQIRGFRIASALSRQTIISIERERFDPSLPLAFLLAKTFDCAIEDIFAPERGERSAGPPRT